MTKRIRRKHSRRMKMSPETFDRLFGSATELAVTLDLPVQTVHAWRRRGQIPAERVLFVEEHSNVSRHMIRPDIYPKERVRA